MFSGYYSCKIIASFPGSPFRILSHSFDFSPKLRDKIRNGEPGNEASKIMACSLIHAGVTSFKDAWSGANLRSFLSGCLMQIANKQCSVVTIAVHALWYMQVWPLSKMRDWVPILEASSLVVLCKYQINNNNHYLFSLSATTVTTLWLKQPICFCSGACCKKTLGYFNIFRSPQLHSFCVCDT